MVSDETANGSAEHVKAAPAQPVNKEAVRMLVAEIGYTEAAQRTGIDRNTLYQWNRRYQWNVPIVHSQHKVVRCVRAPSDVQADVLAEDSKATKIGFSRAARKVAESLGKAKASVLRDKDQAQSAKAWQSIAAGTHGWDAPAKGGGATFQLLAIGGTLMLRSEGGNSEPDES